MFFVGGGGGGGGCDGSTRRARSCRFGEMTTHRSFFVAAGAGDFFSFISISFLPVAVLKVQGGPPPSDGRNPRHPGAALGGMARRGPSSKLGGEQPGAVRFRYCGSWAGAVLVVGLIWLFIKWFGRLDPLRMHQVLCTSLR